MESNSTHLLLKVFELLFKLLLWLLSELVCLDAHLKKEKEGKNKERREREGNDTRE